MLLVKFQSHYRTSMDEGLIDDGTGTVCQYLGGRLRLAYPSNKLSASNVKNFDTGDEHLPSRKNLETSFSSMSAFFIMSVNIQGKEKKRRMQTEKVIFIYYRLLFGSTRAIQGYWVRNWKR